MDAAYASPSEGPLVKVDDEALDVASDDFVVVDVNSFAYSDDVAFADEVALDVIVVALADVAKSDDDNCCLTGNCYNLVGP